MSFLSLVIKQLFGSESEPNSDILSVGGGCIHQAGTFQFKSQKYFIKWNTDAAEMFEKEALGLSLLDESRTINIPKVIGRGKIEHTDYLCLEYIQTGKADSKSWKDFGIKLANLHKKTNEYYGLNHDNFIGALNQSNSFHSNWVEFFINERIIPLIDMGVQKGLVNHSLLKRFEFLFSKLDGLIPEEAPALLHGDLWSGNFLFNENSESLIFDPAVYYGHREAELAFTKLFGGFDPIFYQSYNEVFPMQPGYMERVDIFNLYPLLVHLNLFGSSYLSGIEQTLRRFT